MSFNPKLSFKGDLCDDISNVNRIVALYGISGDIGYFKITRETSKTLFGSRIKQKCYNSPQGTQQIPVNELWEGTKMDTIRITKRSDGTLAPVVGRPVGFYNGSVNPHGWN